MGGLSSRFPETRQSAIVNAGSASCDLRDRAFETIILAYWKPVYKYIRIKWRECNEDAKDMTQAFFARALEKELFRLFDPARGSFRNYMRMCLDGFIANEKKAAARLKRSAPGSLLRLDFESAEGELQVHRNIAQQSVEDYFQQEWTRSLFAMAVDQLRNECEQNNKQIHFGIFDLYDIDSGGERPTYEKLAGRFGLSSTQVTNYLAATRRRFRQIVLEKLREMTADEREFRAEARALLGIEV